MIRGSGQHRLRKGATSQRQNIYIARFGGASSQGGITVNVMLVLHQCNGRNSLID